MNVFSTHVGNLSFPYGDSRGGQRDVCTIRPGRNKVDDEVYAQISDRLDKWQERGYVRTSRDLNKHEVMRMLDKPSRSYITELCAKSGKVHSGKGDNGDFLTADEQRLAGAL